MEEDYGHWDVTKVGNFNPKDFYGFIYEIEEKHTGRLYIGRKQIKTKTKKNNNWREYTSSSKELISLIEEKGKDNFNFRIILLCSGKSQLTYEEEKLQFENDVLRTRLPNGERKFFNKTIGYRNFNGVEKQTEQSRQKISDSNSGKIRTEEMRKKYSQAKKSVPKSQEHREKLRQINLGKKYNDETNSKKGKGPGGVSLSWWNNGISQIRAISPPDNSWKKGRTLVNNSKSFNEEEKAWILENSPTLKEICEKTKISMPTVRKLLKELKYNHSKSA